MDSRNRDERSFLLTKRMRLEKVKILTQDIERVAVELQKEGNYLLIKASEEETATKTGASAGS